MRAESHLGDKHGDLRGLRSFSICYIAAICFYIKLPGAEESDY